ncbi:MAG: thrombospondin type 3 repeat-containing protein, partial [Deltaproteobacteria bacterium]|nr:thrombospondin type 3 repeat-containing protein [Deltaproteobacteria bacterium]
MDSDHDGQGDLCDNDMDGDGIGNGSDNCPAKANDDQGDIDGDGTGDLCDNDLDGDGIENAKDNCDGVSNPDQADANSNGLGDACESTGQGDPSLTGEGGEQVCDELTGDCFPAKDSDGDGIVDALDACPGTSDPSNACTTADLNAGDAPMLVAASTDGGGGCSLVDDIGRDRLPWLLCLVILLSALAIARQFRTK